MNFWEILYTIADNVGVPTTQIGPKLGLNREYVANAKSKQINPSLVVAGRLLSVCGYALTATPLDKITSDCFVIGETSQNDDQANRA